MEATLEAREVGIIDGPDTVAVAFRDPSAREGTPLSYLLLQRSVSLADDDGVYLELGDQRHASHEAVRAFTLAAGRARLDLHPAVAQELGLPAGTSEVRIDLSRAEYDRESLSATLRGGIFRGSAGFFDEAG